MYTEKLLAVLVKLETTSGTDAVPVGTVNAVRPKGIPTFTPGYLAPGLRDDVITGRLGTVARTGPAGRFGTIQVSTEVRGAGATYSSSVKPEVDALLQISGFGAELSAATWRYWPLDAGFPTATVYGYTAGKLIKLVGCVATMSLSATVNEVATMTFTITGRLASDPTEAALPALAYLAPIPPLFNGVVASIGAWLSTAVSDPLVLRTASIDLANVVADRPSAGVADGLIGYLITDRKPRQTLGYEVPQLATHDAFALSKAVDTANPFTAWTIGANTLNRMTVQTGRWAMEMPQLGAQNGIALQTVAGNLVQGTEPVKSGELLLLFD